jgi:acyl-CoA reductase-like NAD-dependent aldehyde dehydrogenase
LRVCGHDPELVQLVCCYPDEANALIQSPTIKHITFIGSDTVGRKVCWLILVSGLHETNFCDRLQWPRPCI